MSDKSKSCPSVDPQSIDEMSHRRRLRRQFIIGMLWLSIWAGLVSFGTETSFWLVLLVVFLLAIGGGAIALFWLARWAERNAPGGQFSIASLFLAMIFVAAFLSCIRWTLVASASARLNRFPATQLGENLEPTLFEFAMTSLFALAMLCASLPIVLGLLDSVMWSAVWLIKRPGFRAFAVRFLRAK